MHYLYYFSYPASPIATIDLNMLPLFYGCCTNKFVVMQARYRPLSSFHLLKLHPRSSAHYTLVNEARCFSDGPRLTIHTWSGAESKKSSVFSSARTRPDPATRSDSFIQARPDMWSDQVKPNFSCTIFGFSHFFFGILGKKSLALSNILFLVGRKFLSKLVNILVGLGILDVSGQVHWVGLPIIRYIHVKYWSRVGFFGSYHHSFPTTCYFLIFNRNIFLFLTGHE